MSDNYKKDLLKQAESLVTELEKQRAAALGAIGAAQLEAQHWQGELQAIESNLAKARAKVEAMK